MTRTPSHIPARSWTEGAVRSDLQEFADFVRAKDMHEPFRALILDVVQEFQRGRGR